MPTITPFPLTRGQIVTAGATPFESMAHMKKSHVSNFSKAFLANISKLSIDNMGVIWVEEHPYYNPLAGDPRGNCHSGRYAPRKYGSQDKVASFEFFKGLFGKHF